MAHFDVVIIGSGAGGGTVAQRLAASGKTILILERGEQLPREAENWSSRAVFIQNRYRTKEQWYDKTGKPFTKDEFTEFATDYLGVNVIFWSAESPWLRK